MNAKHAGTLLAHVDTSTFNAARVIRLAGTTNRKGHDLPDQPHRRASILAWPSDIQVVSKELLESLAATLPGNDSGKNAEKKPTTTTVQQGGRCERSRLKVDAWLRDHGVNFRVKAELTGDGRTVYVLEKCPFNDSHRDPDSCIMQDASGKLSAHCFHNGCQGHGWREFKEKIGTPDPDHYDPPLQERKQSQHAEELSPAPPTTLPIINCMELVETYPKRRPAVIEGLLRVGETANIIASTKIGKSWLMYGMAFAVARGELWLSTFNTVKGKVLLIDNELHPETCAHRLRTMANALDLPLGEVMASIDIINLRGRLLDLHALGLTLRSIERGRYLLVTLDAFYRTLPLGINENDNAMMAGMYNLLDSYADSLGAGFALVHHASKGSQSEKAVTDVGSGAGSQSRAADTHLILRPHEEDNVVVLDAAVRSWPPVSPMCLRWSFPRWTNAPDLDPTALRTGKPRRRRPKTDEALPKTPEPPWTAKRFASAFASAIPKPRGVIEETAQLMGLSDRKIRDLFRIAVECGYLHTWQGDDKKMLVSTEPQPEQPKRSRGRPRK